MRNLSVLSDGDASASSQLAARRRARTTVAEADEAHRAELVEQLVRAMASASALDQIRFAAVASEYDREHPGELSLLDEVLAAVAGDELRAVA
ncbi:hypothetical protein [Streptomyces hoynatensis]|uniref:Uncharacterized protein n=1 Tax=Streptomyces hoynatensis TaxID=1141874 RepID=A0A3A9YYD3_9ACTN|nr:hypothetical protein [Streptomyces hoynatensis]RKN40779.1 hypothetical protein D7294_16965 [Streptomyces hoynatensis]